MRRTTAVIFVLFLSPLSEARIRFVIEHWGQGSKKPEQVVEFSESEKEKKYRRLADQAECSLRLGEVSSLVASYRKVELELDCQSDYSQTQTTFVCLDSDRQAHPVTLREKRGSAKSLELDLADLLQGITLERQKNRKSRAVTKLAPAWDQSGCQNLGEAFAQLAGKVKVRCCLLP